jgi:Protein of unknown function (DUF2950)
MCEPAVRALVALFILVAAVPAAHSHSAQQQDFASPGDAVQALVAAVQSNDRDALLGVLGNDVQPLIDSGDPVQDRNARERFLQAYRTGHTLDTNADGTTTLQIGTDQWPFPFPLIERNGRWLFDSSAGADEIINRRIGANEFAAIRTCLAFVDAEREYYRRNPEQNRLQQFAQKLVSSEGRKDGLYWPTTGDEAPSPLGVQFAHARAEGYFKQGARRGEPYHGYIYRLLTAQGPHAAGGAYDYMVHGQMLGGFALIAIPAEYGSSGVMSFMVDHGGVVFSKDLGRNTAQAAMAIKSFDPDPSWKREADIAQEP